MPYFSSDSLRFLRGLARNNHKTWFEAHRDDYQQHVKEPIGELVEELAIRMQGFAPEMTGDPRRSVFRIHRDVRFSRDKSPYKTHAACWFYHRAGEGKVGREAEGGSAGFYFHLEPGGSMVGGGLWMPPRRDLNRLRAAIARDLSRFERAARDPRLRKRFGELSEEGMLKRLPRGYPCGHPAERWLKHQSFTVGRSLKDAEVTRAKLPAELARDFQLMLPLVRWINRELGFDA
ncbi:MAG TPA: DUF2461 domain-containing protein [Candidatus Sulfotelmatobacter sp.]|nr:DUF2461 domain-containing protein [Candidatus Sulfotelmatobacter sp.]